MRHFLSCLIALITFSAFSQPATKDLALKDFFTSRNLYPKSPTDLQSMKDGDHYCIQDNDSVIEYEYLTGNRTRLLFCVNDLKLPGQQEAVKMTDFAFSKDESKLLITTEPEFIYRRSFVANYYVYNLKSKILNPVSEKGKQSLASFSPDGSKIAFVRNNNLFIKYLANGAEEQITQDGLINNIINGGTDWVYEEEFEFSQGYQWSPNGNKLAYYRFDESKVKEYTMTKWGDLYPEQYKYKYPKAGEDNSLVTIHIYDVTSKTTKLVDIGKETDQYIPRIKWTANPNILALYRMNRHQNKLELLLADAGNGSTRVFYTEENRYYIEITDNWIFTDDNKFVIMTSSKDGYNHIYLYGMDGKMIHQLTHGNWDVDQVKGFDPVKRVIYYTSTEDSPINRDLCSINLDGTRKKKLNKTRGWNDGDFSNNFKYYVARFSDANTPPRHSVNQANGKELRVLEDNKALVDAMSPYGFRKVEFFTIKVPDGTELWAYMIKPRDFDSTRKYPVFMNVYGGPGSQSVVNRFGRTDYYWYQMLGQQGYISVCVDNRGTPYRGEAFMKATYGGLGNLDFEDQLNAARYLSGLKYVDATRIGIWGWSYGGTMAALGVTKGADVFKMGIAVAPVTNWRYYDNIYTERYMGLPKENEKGYDENTPMAYAKNLKGKFLLVHGTADDNVHLQNSMELVTALIKENKQFDMFFYPNRNHSLIGPGVRYNLYQKMTDYILKNL